MTLSTLSSRYLRLTGCKVNTLLLHMCIYIYISTKIAVSHAFYILVICSVVHKLSLRAREGLMQIIQTCNGYKWEHNEGNKMEKMT